MNCLHCNKHIYSYCDGELAPQFMLEMERHLAECPSCRFQYELTMTENQVLHDTSDIPDLASDFNQKVMNAIMPEKIPTLPGNVLVMSKDRRFPFRRSTMFILSAVAVVILALCINLPDILSIGKQKVAQTNDASNMHFNEPQMKKAITGAAPDITQNNQKQLNNTSNVQYGTTAETEITTINDNTQLAGTSRMTNCEAGRADRIAAKSETLSVSSLAVNNIPEKFKLTNQNNSAANLAEYSYQTTDGTETINIQLSCLVAKAALLDKTTPKEAAAPLASMAPPAAAETISGNVNREIKIDGETISIVLSGNVSIDELNSFADQIVLSKTP